MMRSMYSGVSGLKTHQTKMDVIGNNIANVNTVAFKSSSTTFSEIFYQRITGASGPSATGRGGINAKQIGLGVNMASTTINISSPGASQTTGGAFDLMLTGDSFFIVNGGSGNLFTKAGAFDIDEAGTLVMKSTGYNVMGWQVDPATGTIRKDTVSPLRIMQEANLTSPPESTTLATCAGILDKHDKNVNSEEGYAMSLTFYDALGYSYTAKFAVKSTNIEGEYTVELKDVVNSVGTSIVDELDATSLEDIVTFGTQNVQTERRPVELLQTNGIAYDPTKPEGQRYTKQAAFPLTAANFDTLKVSGFTYPEGNGGVTAAGGKLTATATAQFTADDMAKYYGVVFDSTTQTYKRKVTDPNTGQETMAEVDNWGDVLGIPDDGTVIFDPRNTQYLEVDPVSGAIKFSIDHTFDVDPNVLTDAAGNPVDVGGMNQMYITQEEAYGLEPAGDGVTYDFAVADDGRAVVTINTTSNGNVLKFDVDDGYFMSIAGGDAVQLTFKDNLVTRGGQTISLGNFSDISVDFSTTKWFDNGGASTMGTDAGGGEGGLEGKGKKLGDLIGLSVSQNGMIWADYDNGNTTLLGQIAVAVFPNPAGLEKVGENCFQTTLNSGEFDGIGQDVTADGGKMTSGVLEMSNVDLSTEFTEMITTQRGFQANSRIITTSDTLLEELINLKR